MSTTLYYTMKNKGIFIFCVSFLLIFSDSVIGQSNALKSPFEASLNPGTQSGENTPQNEIIDWVEDISARALFSSTYYSEDGQIKIIYSKRAINYYNTSNELVPINAELTQLDKDSWGAIHQPYPTYLSNDGCFRLTLEDKNRITYGKNCKINGQSIKTDFIFTGNKTTLYNVIPGVDKELIFRENGVKFNYILNQPLEGNPDNYVFSEKIEIPAGCVIKKDETYGKQTKEGWNGNMVVTDQFGKVVSTLYLPVCYDATNQHVTGSYRISNESGSVVLEIIIPEEWMNAPERVYPVVVDPLVMGPTTTWTGGTMPSCIIPSYNQDSIQVTIPAGVTVTELNVTASFYADPWTTAVMNDGAMFFSTDCANSQTFTITGAPGTSPGTAYLDSYNMSNPLNCCFPESCNVSSFYLSYHLGRTQPGAGCNTTYIRYDPVTTSWPFEAVIIGKTPETYGGQWSVSPTPICSNQCTISGTGYVYYGVAPYTFTHPWTTDTVTVGQNNGCASGATNHIFSLTIPNCPSFCDESFTSLNVPPPTITDACGNTVAGLPTKVVPIKVTPEVNAVYDMLVCSEEPYTIDLTSCVPTATIEWSGNGNTGTGDISETATNNTSGVINMEYLASASDNGCYSDTIIIPLEVQPLPIPNFSIAPEPIIAGVESSFTDETVINAGIGIEWFWLFGDETFSFEQNPTHLYVLPGEYELCLGVTNDNGCTDTICEMITVVPAELNLPNIITANNDGVNDFLEFTYLEFYPDNELIVLNRWGEVVYQKSAYTNDWGGAGLTEGTYFYLLNVKDIDKTYNGFFQLVR